jgi:N-acetylmuramoyl-L-alanine amidase
MKRSLLIPALALLAGCAAGPRIDTTYTSVNQDSRAQFIVIHFTNESFESSLKTLVERSGRPVSSHYLVRDDPPTVYRLVDESRRAWHAGVSSWRRNSALNSASIGIEIVNAGETGSPPGTSPGDLVFAEYPQAQIDAVVALVKDIAQRHGVAPANIVGHSDIAPQRKVDPGPKFPWKRLADEGLIPWPDASKVAERRAGYERELPDVAWFQDHLYRHGFEVPRDGALDEQTVRVISAFQMKYRPERYDGFPDAHTAAILDVLVDP